jgi:hypothetical protein
VRQVEARTEGKSLPWEDTANEDVFQAIIGTLTVRIGDYYDDEVGEAYKKLELLNANGRLVDAIYPHQLRDSMSNAESVFTKILDGARHIARKVDQTLAEAIKELHQLESEDEIPF